jgi:hypothetical protein
MNQIVSDIIDNVINTIKVKELRCQICDNNNLTYDYEKMIKQLKNENNQIEKLIYKTCKHNWDRDYDDLYSRYKVCTKCKLVNYPYVYK